ncbi:MULTISPECIES: thiamine pyrophosphate-binding protein [unclassified Leifsonia]|uniref:alpha-keto acid decarboxylase family protein n=1 Tax=unclassified Leifsonia TaxID=2663824 RepID=UPI0008A75A82|nr:MULTISPECIES: thiamine pyrophosphate-binding protein [unclassified Leifsonia]SEH65337.1 indolepyruvate decarboxylase [Leifsonia sp. CL154]SFL27207.1 indolepyruvate decarboxylase [Leifsonia sp. CL147]
MSLSTNTTSDHLTVGGYLATRLAQLGADQVFGLPGDFNLTLLDEMLATGEVRWVGASNELNAAYAADGFSRVGRRLGALVTTFGVGELSAINGIAGAFAEDVPVVHIGGMPSTTTMDSGTPLHHTFLDGDFSRFLRMFSEVTAAQVVLSASDAAAEIDRILGVALATSKPVYIGVPLDVASAPVEPEGLNTVMVRPASDPGAVAAFEKALRVRASAENVVTVLAGPRIQRLAVEQDLRDLAELPGVQIASQSGAKAILDERHPASLGTYVGKTTRSEEARARVDSASFLVLAGTVMSDFTTGFFSNLYIPSDAVELAIDHARIGHAVYPGVRLEDAIRVLREVVAEKTFPPCVPVARGPRMQVALDPGSTLDHESFWSLVEPWIGPDTTVIAEAGTAFYGALDLDLPERSDLLGSPVWSSIGYAIPAMLGAGLARPDRRPILFIGDGSAQLTVQELGTVFARGLNPVVFLLNNDGYTIERIIQSPEAKYQDVVSWDWASMPTALGATHVDAVRVTTVSELEKVLLRATATPGRPFFVEVALPVMDAPRLLIELVNGIAETNARIPDAVG